MTATRNVVILRGCSGSGKSTLAKRLLQKHLAERRLDITVLLSADDYFMAGGKYNFEPAKLTMAHSSCLRNFVEAARNNIQLIIVDNTNTTVAEIAPYYQVAQAYDFNPKIVTLDVEPLLASSRNIHSTPIDTILKQKMRLDAETARFPPWWKHERENGEPYPR